MSFPPKNKSEWLRLPGIGLFVLSFIPPGINAFLFTPQYSFAGFVDAFEQREWHRGVCASALMLGWLTNFTVFFRIPRIASCVAVASPWLAYLAIMFLSYSRGVEAAWPNMWVTTFIPFYPWAFGIGLLHVSRLLESSPRELLRNEWAGF